ncbi:response regulator [Massilia sp. KIM]|uniref:response regulator n=1 Tax=Massilia sp. KIM TaxID=1955422 RepID=UPI00098F29FB|nr:response regulator [Massilia sp. KIM]OON63827.1 response regulator [Massilia sp. KIM]
MKVLVVDDDVVSRMMLMHLIDSSGSHEILEAEDGEDAWRQLQAGPAPDLVFCDLRMPRLSGLGLLERVRADAALCRQPFVLVSSAADAATMAEAAGLGADGYIVKPFRLEDVRMQFARLDGAAQADEDESPAGVVRRLGIDGARLQLYLDGLGRQLDAAGPELAALLAAGELDAVLGKLKRLREGCATLGLRGAAAALEQLEQFDACALDAGRIGQALGRAGASVLRQAERTRHG